MKVVCGDNTLEADYIVNKYGDMLFKVAMTRMNDTYDAQDIVQETFMKMLLNVKKGKIFKDEEHLKAWLLTVAVNSGKSFLNLAWNKRTRGLADYEDVAVAPYEVNYAYDYVMRLTEKYRIAIFLFYYQQLSTEQIADIVKQKPSTVRSYLNRGREQLRKMMEADGYVG